MSAKMLESDADFKSGLELSAVRLVIYNRVPKTGELRIMSIAKGILNRIFTCGEAGRS